MDTTSSHLHFLGQVQGAPFVVVSQQVEQPLAKGGWQAQQHAILEEQQRAQQRHHCPLPHPLQAAAAEAQGR